MITSYEQLYSLPDRSVVQDADGNVWCVEHHGDEVWLSPFSDEYSYTVRKSGENYALGDTPTLPITPLNVVTKSGG